MAGRGLNRLSKQKSVMNIEANPLESGNIQSAAMKVESLSDCTPISTAELSTLIARLTALEANEERLKVLEEAKLPYIFASEQLLKMLEITTSIKTKIQMIAQIGPRLSDPRAKTQQFLDLFRYSEEKNQVEEILKARNQAILSSQFSAASTGGGGRGGGGRGGLLGGRGGRGAGRGAGIGNANNAPTNRPLPAAPVADSVGAPTEESSSSDQSVLKTPAKNLHVSTNADPMSFGHPFSPSSTVSTPGNESVVTDIHDVFNFLDSAGSPPSARASRRITMDTITEQGGDDNEEDSDDDEEEGEDGKRSHPVADDTSLTTAETAPSVSTFASTNSPCPTSQATTGTLVHNLSDGSLTETDSKAADAAVALIAAIVAKETVTENPQKLAAAAASSTVSPLKIPPPIETSTVVSDVKSPHESPSSSRPNSLKLTEKSLFNNGSGRASPLIHSKSTSALDLSARPRSLSGNSDGGVRSGTASPRNNVPGSPSSSGHTSIDRTSLLRQSLHHSSFTAGHMSKDEELQAVASASSQMRQVAAKIFSGGDKESAIAAVTATTSIRGIHALQRTQSEVMTSDLSRSIAGSLNSVSSVGSMIGANAAMTGGSGSGKAAMCSASDDVAMRYALQAKLSKDEFLALTPAEMLCMNEDNEPQFAYVELLRRNFRKEYGDLKQSELQRYLVETEFVEVFKRSKKEFEAQAKWRQVDQKKKALLF